MSASESKKHKLDGEAKEERFCRTTKEEHAVSPHEDNAEMTVVIEEKDDTITALEKKIEALEVEAAQYKGEAQRARADFHNYQTRVENNKSRDRILAAERTVDALLPVLDNLDRTLHAVTDKESALFKGVAMVQRQFFGAMESLGLQVIDTTGAFDPSVHEAMMVADVTDDKDDGAVLEELHRGYKLGDKVLRAAQVKVGKKKING